MRPLRPVLRAILLIVGLYASGCGGEDPVRTPAPATTPTGYPDSTAQGATSTAPPVSPRLWRRAANLHADERQQPDIRVLLERLEGDYFEGEHAYVISACEQLLNHADVTDELRLRLYYLLARSHARDRNPSRARHYEQLFRELYQQLRGAPPRDGDDHLALQGVLDRSRDLMHVVHPGWTRDQDGNTWANVRLHRLLERAGPRDVLTEQHPGGGIVHISMDAEALQEFLEAEGLLDDRNPIQRDPRFSFYYFLEERR